MRRGWAQIRLPHRLRFPSSLGPVFAAWMRLRQRERRKWRLRWNRFRRYQSSDDHQLEPQFGNHRRQRLYVDSEWHKFRCLGNQCQVERNVVNDDLCDRLRGYSAGNNSDDRYSRYGHGQGNHCGRNFFWRFIHHQCSIRPDGDGRTRAAANAVPADELVL